MTEESTDPPTGEINGENVSREEPLPVDDEKCNEDTTVVDDEAKVSPPKEELNGDATPETDSPIEETSEKEEISTAVVDDAPKEEQEAPPPVEDSNTNSNGNEEDVVDNAATGDAEVTQSTDDFPKTSSNELEDHQSLIKEDEKKTGEMTLDTTGQVEDDEKKDSELPTTPTNSTSVEIATDGATLDSSDSAAENQMSTPVSSPNRPSSLSSTPDHPSSFSSTPDRPSLGEGTGANFEIQDDDTWTAITKRDRPLSNANAIHVMDHAHTVLEKRISDATDDFNMKDNLKIFHSSLGRFQNSEIKLGRRYVFFSSHACLLSIFVCCLTCCILLKHIIGLPVVTLRTFFLSHHSFRLTPAQSPAIKHKKMRQKKSK